MTFSANDVGIDTADGPGVHFRCGQIGSLGTRSRNSLGPRKSKFFIQIQKDKGIY